jgi:hypothetical protein
VNYNMHLHMFQCYTTCHKVYQWLSKLSWTLDWLRAWSFSFLSSMHTQLESSQFCAWEYLKPKVCASSVHSRRELWDQIQQFASKIITFSFFFTQSCVYTNMYAISTPPQKKKISVAWVTKQTILSDHRLLVKLVFVFFYANDLTC